MFLLDRGEIRDLAGLTKIARSARKALEPLAGSNLLLAETKTSYDKCPFNVTLGTFSRVLREKKCMTFCAERMTKLVFFFFNYS